MHHTVKVLVIIACDEEAVSGPVRFYARQSYEQIFVKFSEWLSWPEKEAIGFWWRFFCGFWIIPDSSLWRRGIN